MENVVRVISIPEDSQKVICDDRQYFFLYANLKENISFPFPKLAVATVLLAKAGPTGFLQVASRRINEGESICLIQPFSNIIARNSDCRVLVAGVHSAVDAAALEKPAKFVNKPWGFEKWHVYGDKNYVFKHIHIKKGNRTSLQFHQEKRETNFLFQGKIRLFLSAEGSVNCAEKAGNHKLLSKIWNAPIAIDVPPMSIHRIEALSDCDLYEVSTPEVDDVVRIHDDTARANGRIAAEHGERIE